MEDMGILDAWTLWLQGVSVDSYYLWGIPILWWGRIGKIVQLASGLFIIAEIIGPVRIREFGHSLHGAITADMLLAAMRDNLYWSAILLRFAFKVMVILPVFMLLMLAANAPPRIRQSRLFRTVDRCYDAVFAKSDGRDPVLKPTHAAYFTLNSVVALAVAYRFIDTIGYDPNYRPFYGAVFFQMAVFSFIFIAPAVTAFATLSLLATGVLLDAALVDPLAWILELQSVDKILRTISVVLLIVGVHFDLLAS